MPELKKSHSKNKLFIFSITFSLLISYSEIIFSQQPKLILPFGHSGVVNSVEFSPDNKRFITGSADKTAKLWDVESNRILANFIGHDDQVNNVLFSNDGKFICTAGGSKLYIWDAKSGKKLKDLQGVESFITIIKISPDSKNILVGQANGHLLVYDINSGNLLKTLNCYLENNVKNEAETELKAGLAILDKMIKEEKDEDEKKDLEEQKKELLDAMKMMNAQYKNTSGIIPYAISDVVDITFSNDYKSFITIVNDRIKIWNSKNLNLIKEIQRPGGPNVHCQFDKSDLSIVCFSNGGFINTWNIKTGKKLNDYDNSKNNRVIYSAFGKNETLVSLIENGNLKIYNKKTGKLNKQITLKSNAGKITDALILTDNNEILIAYENGKLISWLIETGQKLVEFTGHEKEVLKINFSKDKTKIITCSNDNTVKIWNKNTGSLISNIKKNTNELNSAFYSNDNKSVIVSQKNQAINIWNYWTGENIRSIQHNEKDVEFARLDAKDKNIVISLKNGKYKEFVEPGTFKTLDEKSQNNYGQKFGYRNESYALAEINYPTSGNNRLDFGNLKNVMESDELELKENIRIRNTKFPPFFKTIDFFYEEPNTNLKRKPDEIKPDGDGIFNFAKFSPDGEQLLVASSEMRAYFYSSTDSRYLSKDLEGHENAVNYVDFSNNGKLALTASHDGTAKLWDLGYGKKPPITFSGHTAKVNSVQFNNEETMLITASDDNTFKIWNANNGKEIASFFSLDNKKLFTFLPSGYYASSSVNVKNLHYVTDKLEVISFEQLDVKYNRPDKVLQALGNKDIALIQSYKLAYEKRIEKLKIDTTAFAKNYDVPLADFANRENIQIDKKSNKIKLHIKGEDKKSKLAQFNVWINEVPVYGLRGVSIRHRNRNDIDTTITVSLSEGENNIEMSVRNTNAIESYRMPLTIKYNSETKPKEKVYFVGIGIDKFKDNSRDLMYSVKDIRVLTTEMQKKYGNSLVIVDTLINTKVTVENVKALKKKLLTSTVDDKVIVAYSGHGLLNEKNAYYLSTYSVNFGKPEENGLSYDDLESIIDSIPARKKLLLLDACHSGEVDGEGPQKINKTDQANNVKNRNKKGTKGGPKPLENTSKNRIGLKNSFELMQSLFVNVGKNTGATIFTAAAGKQAAYESNKLGHGVFTYYIIDAFRNQPTIRVSKLKEFVAENVEKESKKSQIPTSRSETIAVDWVLW